MEIDKQGDEIHLTLCRDAGAVAKAVAQAGADGITAINSLGPGVILDIDIAKSQISSAEKCFAAPAGSAIIDFYDQVAAITFGPRSANIVRSDFP